MMGLDRPIAQGRRLGLPIVAAMKMLITASIRVQAQRIQLMYPLVRVSGVVHLQLRRVLLLLVQERKVPL